MAVLVYTITPANGSAPFTVSDGGAGSTQAQAADFACGKTVAGFTGTPEPEVLACRMRTFKVNHLSDGAAGSKNYGAYCYDPNYVLASPRGCQFNVSAGV